MKLKIVSWNIWIDGYFDQVAEFLKNADADILGLQEVVDNDPKHDVINFLTKLGYEYAFAPILKTWGNESWNDGPAIFSKHKILNKQNYVLSETDSRAAAGADIQVGNKILHAFSTHLLHTHQQPSEVQELQISNLLKILPANGTIVMGDFNATPDSVGIQMMNRALFNADSLNMPTWSVYPAGCLQCNPQRIDTRLDYIFTTKDIKTSSYKVESSKGSDHLPISVQIEI